MSKVKVLFLSANPVATNPLEIDKEIRKIGVKLRASDYRDAFEFIPRFAARPDDLLQALLEHKPEIVHFSGHGSTAQELIFLDDQGNEKPVTKQALVHVFRTLKDNIRLVLLNACSSRPQAKAIAETIDCTIGMRKPIGDEAAVVFTASFYRALGFGRSVQEAFELGKAALLLEGIAENKTPELMTRPGVDPAALVLVKPAAAAKSKPKAGKPTKPKPASVSKRLALVRDLSGLAPAQWATLVTSIPGAAAWVSRQGTVAEQVAELVRWAESSTGPRLVAVEQAYKELPNP